MGGRHIKGRGNNFNNILELSNLINEYSLKDFDTFLTIPEFPYIPLFKAMSKNSKKEISHLSELALEIKLLSYELSNIPNIKSLEEMRQFLVDFSKELSFEEIKRLSYRRLAA